MNGVMTGSSSTANNKAGAVQPAPANRYNASCARLYLVMSWITEWSKTCRLHAGGRDLMNPVGMGIHIVDDPIVDCYCRGADTGRLEDIFIAPEGVLTLLNRSGSFRNSIKG